MHWSGRIVLCVWLCAGVSQAQVRLDGDTSEPRHSLFVRGQPVVLTFVASGLARDARDQLLVTIEDEHARVLREYTIPLQEGRREDFQVRCSPTAQDGGVQWQIDLYPPTSRLGFFKANAQLSSGAQLQGVCTRPPGYLTYAIVPDPTERRAYPAEDTFFGMMGAVTPGVLGQSWQVHNYGMYCWSAFEPDNPSQFAEKVKEYEAEEARGGWAGMPHFVGRHFFEIGGRSGSIPAYSVLPIGKPPLWAARNETRVHHAAALHREGERAFRDFCLRLGRYLADQRSDEAPHYYQITSEPQIPWGYQGTTDELVRIFEIAYSALHEVDPHAIVAGPAIGLDAFEQLEEMLQKGLADHLDVLDFHPYMGGDVLPSEFNLVGRIRGIKELMSKYAGRQLRLTGTESGFDAKGESTQTWLRMAWSDIHHNLILLGEGFWFNVCFHGADNSRHVAQNTWGHAFNLDPERDYGVQKTSPKPVVPAYAAMTLLLEGHKSAGAIERLGDAVTGYAYERGQDVILALWSDEPCEVHVPVGAAQVDVVDWMGNAAPVSCPQNMLTLTLTRDPQYVKGVSPDLWGTQGREKPVTVEEARIPER